MQLLTDYKRDNVRLQQVTYVVNRWALGGIIPMTHHGFIFQTSNGYYFTLDFGRKGIVWDVMDELPENPDNTFYTKSYSLDMDTRAVQKYCEETPPFNFPFYDCETWAKGMLAALNLEKSADQSGRRISKNVCAPSMGQASGGYTPTPVVRMQRSGTCI